MVAVELDGRWRQMGAVGQGHRGADGRAVVVHWCGLELLTGDGTCIALLRQLRRVVMRRRAGGAAPPSSE